MNGGTNLENLKVPENADVVWKEYGNKNTTAELIIHNIKPIIVYINDYPNFSSDNYISFVKCQTPKRIVISYARKRDVIVNLYNTWTNELITSWKIFDAPIEKDAEKIKRDLKTPQFFILKLHNSKKVRLYISRGEIYYIYS